MKSLVIIALCVLKQTSGIILTLNESEYDRMPRFSHLDEFESCLLKHGDVYCYVTAKLVLNYTDELSTMIQDYSAANLTHYDHNYIQRGICVAKTCQDFLGNSTDLDWTLEACLNSSLTRSHQMQTRLVNDARFCYRFEDSVHVDAGDVALVIVIITIIVLNMAGSLYDIYCVSNKTSFVGRFLLCFSMKRNWQRLTMPLAEGSSVTTDPKLLRLKGLAGIKTIILFLVIFGHTPMFAGFFVNNPQFLEASYKNPIFQFTYSSTNVIQIFFIVSGFLLAFNTLVTEEKAKMTMKMLHKGILYRWLRFTPPYAVTLAFISTWSRHVSGGPLRKQILGLETESCRRDWFYHLLYVNNYVKNSHCMLHTWYLAADMQLTVLGLLIFCLLASAKARKLAILATCVVGLITPVVSVYLQNLHPMLLCTPEFTRHYFLNDPTLDKLHKPAHTNILCYAMGLYLGIMIYEMMKSNYDEQKLKKYVIIFWAILAVNCLLIMSGVVFYMKDIHVPLALRALYSSGSRFIFGFTGIVIITMVVFRLENVCRAIVEWSGWASLSRTSYCAYLVHWSIICITSAKYTTLVHFSYYQLFLTYTGILVLAYLVAAPCWLFIEAPFGQLMKLFLSPDSSKDASKEKTISTANGNLEERSVASC